MKRLELGDDYQSSDTEESGLEEDEEDSYGDESYGEEVFSKMGGTPMPMEMSPAMGNGLSRVNEDGTESVTHTINAEQINMINDQFNPLRFIALHLKELNEIAK